MHNKELFIHDWDGTLARTLDAWIPAYQDKFKKYGMKQIPEINVIVDHLGDRQIARWFDIPQIEEFTNDVDVDVGQRLQEVKLYDGAKEYLDRARQIGRLTIASSSPRATLEHSITYTGLDGYFDAIYAVEDVKYQKPHPEVINATLRNLGVLPTKAVLIGESHKDLQAGNKAGVETILMFPPEHADYYDYSKLTKLNPSHVVSSFEELSKLLFD